MKNIIKITSGVIILLGLLTISLNSCDKSEKINENNTEINNSDLKSGTNSASVNVECSGSCEDEDSGCGAYWNIPEGRIECTCSNGCAMVITMDNESGRSTVPRSDMSALAEHFLDYIDRIHGTENYIITNFKHTFYDLAEFIEVKYTLNGNTSEIYSIVYLVEFPSTDPDASPSGSVSVDCHGSCDTATEKCVEVYDTSTGEVYCKCESDNCKMTIEEL